MFSPLRVHSTILLLTGPLHIYNITAGNTRDQTKKGSFFSPAASVLVILSVRCVFHFGEIAALSDFREILSLKQR